MAEILSPMGSLMREDECKAGRRCVQPGAVEWFPFRDWYGDSVVSVGAGEVHIVAIVAKHPGTGAFRRLIDGIKSAGLIPVVVVPFAHMQAILRRWGWAKTIRGSGFHAREEWREVAP